MANSKTISERIFERWTKKLRGEQVLPEALIEAIELLHEQGRLSDQKVLSELLDQIVEEEDD